VADGTLTQEDADAILLEMAECDSEPSFIGKTYSLFFGQQGDKAVKGGFGPGEDAPRMNLSETAPRGPQAGGGFAR
jgi:hypothetical protein